jgi:DNA-binding CsgD family transcriptional regulator
MIIDEIYDGLTDDEAFAALPARLADLAGARSCTLQAFGVDGSLLVLAGSGHFSTEIDELYVTAGFAEFDPWRPGCMSRLNLACSSADYLDLEDYQRSPFYNELYRPFGDDTAHCLGAAMPHRHGLGALGLHRGLSKDTFSPDEVERIQPLVRHLRRLLEVRCVLAGGREDAKTLSDLIDAAPLALFVVDGGGRLLFCNAKGLRLCDPGGVFALRFGLLRAHQRADLMSSLIQAAVRHGRDGAMELPTSDGRSLRAVVAPWRTGERTRAVVMIDDPATPDTSLPAKLSGLYGLTAAEAEVAAALAEGLSPTEIAERREVSLATVRSQIHQALRKSDARSLADLVRLAASAPRLGRSNRDDV